MTAITAQTINTQNHGPNKAAVSGHDHSYTQDHAHGPNCGCPSHKHEHKEVEAKHKHDQPDVKTNKTDKDSVAEIQDKLFGKLVNHSEQTSEKMEKLGILEFRIYGVLSLASAIINGFRGRVALPNSTLFANFAESMPEILTKVLQQDKEKAFKKLSGGGLNGLLGKFAIKAANLRGIKNKDGSKITTIKDVMANRDKVTGATITTINGISFADALMKMGLAIKEFIKASKKQESSRSNTMSKILGLSSIATAINAGNMWTISSTQEAYSNALYKLNKANPNEEQKEQRAKINAGANEDYRCGMKSSAATISTILDSILPKKYGQLIDSIIGAKLSFEGLKNGKEAEKGHEEEEDSTKPTIFTKGALSPIRSLMHKYASMTFKFIGGMKPSIAELHKFGTKEGEHSADELKEFHAKLAAA